MDSAELKHLLRQAAAAPRQRNAVVFFGRQMAQFNDNGKYAFLHCARKVPELECCCLTANRADAKTLAAAGLPALSMDDTAAVERLLRASVVVCDDFHWRMDPALAALLHPAKVVQLWHGIPLKAIGFLEVGSAVNMTPDKAEFLRRMYSGYDTVASTSAHFTEQAFGRCFAARRFAELGYPRNDILQRPATRDDMLNTDAGLYAEAVRRRKAGARVVMFMPTFRDGGGGPLEDGALDLGRLAAFAARHNLLVLLKLHPYVQMPHCGPLPDTLRVVPPQTDAYPLLAMTDLLLTDYSSVYFDYLLTGRPMVFYPYDLERYVSRDRALLFDYAAMTPGPKARTQDELFACLEGLLAHGRDDHAPERERLAALAHDRRDGKAAERLGEYLVNRFVHQQDGRIDGQTKEASPCTP